MCIRDRTTHTPATFCLQVDIFNKLTARVSAYVSVMIYPDPKQLDKFGDDSDGPLARDAISCTPHQM
eukprot:3832764-Heterocapsa_arctica.AAC.1